MAMWPSSFHRQDRLYKGKENEDISFKNGRTIKVVINSQYPILSEEFSTTRNYQKRAPQVTIKSHDAKNNH